MESLHARLVKEDSAVKNRITRLHACVGSSHSSMQNAESEEQQSTDAAWEAWISVQVLSYSALHHDPNDEASSSKPSLTAL